MRSSLFILFSFISIVGFGQDTISFTNKAEAKNLIVNGKKEGKWVEYIGDSDKTIEDSNGAFYYRLTTYIADNPDGIVRWYYEMSKKLSRNIPYTNGIKNGIERWYFESGNLQWEAPWTNGKLCGVEKIFYESGKVK